MLLLLLLQAGALESVADAGRSSETSEGGFVPAEGEVSRRPSKSAEAMLLQSLATEQGLPHADPASCWCHGGIDESERRQRGG